MLKDNKFVEFLNFIKFIKFLTLEELNIYRDVVSVVLSL